MQQQSAQTDGSRDTEAIDASATLETPESDQIVWALQSAIYDSGTYIFGPRAFVEAHMGGGFTPDLYLYCRPNRSLSTFPFGMNSQEVNATLTDPAFVAFWQATQMETQMSGIDTDFIETREMVGLAKVLGQLATGWRSYLQQITNPNHWIGLQLPYQVALGVKTTRRLGITGGILRQLAGLDAGANDLAEKYPQLEANRYIVAINCVDNLAQDAKTNGHYTVHLEGSYVWLSSGVDQLVGFEIAVTNRATGKVTFMGMDGRLYRLAQSEVPRSELGDIVFSALHLIEGDTAQSLGGDGSAAAPRTSGPQVLTDSVEYSKVLGLMEGVYNTLSARQL